MWIVPEECHHTSFMLSTAVYSMVLGKKEQQQTKTVVQNNAAKPFLWETFKKSPHQHSNNIH
jgi:hypothetical protein